jgi:hypothetical protein
MTRHLTRSRLHPRTAVDLRARLLCVHPSGNGHRLPAAAGDPDTEDADA